MASKLKVLALDQLYGLRTYFHSLFHRSLNFTFPGRLDKPPIVLIQGIMQKWNVFRKLVPMLLEAGHPVYIVRDLKRNRKPVETQARVVADYIERKNLHNVIIISHSKGGLIGKHIMAFNDPAGRILKLITIATPFHGTGTAKLLPFGSHKEIIEGSDMLSKLEQATKVNDRIVSIYGQWDNLIWPVESSKLAGAKNIQVQFSGHHRIMFEPKVAEIILKELVNV